MVDRSETLNGPIFVEVSDERLAAVEEAKRTGSEFQSVGTKGSQVVDREIVAEATVEWSNEGNTADSDMPEYLVKLKEEEGDVAELNEHKAAEHSEISNEIAKMQVEDNIKAEDKLRKDPMYFANAVAARNEKIAAEYAKSQNAFAKARMSEADQFSQEVVRISRDEAYSEDPVTVLGKQAKVKDISESAAKEALQDKDKIIYGATSFKAEAKRTKEESKEAEPERAQKPVNAQKQDIASKDVTAKEIKAQANEAAEG